MTMNLQCARLRLAIASPPPAAVATPVSDRMPKAANDNYPLWPLIPFPVDWHASN
jgi:hypothetical protein